MANKKSFSSGFQLFICSLLHVVARTSANVEFNLPLRYKTGTFSPTTTFSHLAVVYKRGRVCVKTKFESSSLTRARARMRQPRVKVEIAAAAAAVEKKEKRRRKEENVARGRLETALGKKKCFPWRLWRW